MTVTDHDETGANGVSPPGPDRPAPQGARRRRSHGAPAPAARFEPGRVADARHRNPTWVVAGLLLVVLSALGGVVLFTSTDERADVLVAAVDLEPGKALTTADLRIERVALDRGVRSIPAADAGALVGQHASGRIPAGTMLSPAMFEDAVALGPDEVVIGAALDPGEAPMSLIEVGDRVELLDVTMVASAGPAAPDAAAAPTDIARSLGTGTVWAVEQLASGQVWLSVRVDRSVGLTVSVTSATDRLRVALIGGDG
jgi:hypothetical protein